ncbi:MAG: hypothetical protein V1706_00055 [Pseudomonadota bacterium]
MLGQYALTEVESMSSYSKVSCWEIMQCGNEKCTARENGKACWEIADELDDYRSALNVCSDCLVYISQQQNGALSREEIDEILQQKGVCLLRGKCNNF